MYKIVLLDNGHGQETKGKRSPKWKDGTQLFEYAFNRDVVALIAKKLDAEGIKYKILVPEQIDISLAERCRRANRINAENGGQAFLISIHGNAGGGTGWECYTSKGVTRSDKIADILYEKAQKHFPDQKMRKDLTDGDADKEEQFYILKHTACPAVLTENFFMDNEKDCRLMMNEKEKIAQLHVDAIKSIFNL